MKLVRRNLERDQGGVLTLIPEDEEDMWHVYNLIAVGDSVRASTIRSVTTESSTGTTNKQRVRTTLTLAIETIDFDTKVCKLRLKGRNVEENQHVKMGAYHTLDLELNRQFDLKKSLWDSVSLERVEMATDVSKKADLAAIVMQEGLAHVCLVTSSLTLVRAKIDVNVPRKHRGGVSQHEKALHKFFDAIMTAAIRHLDFEVVKVVLIASPGFVKDLFFTYMMNQAAKAAGVGGPLGEAKVLLENKAKFVLVHASSGFKHSLKEVLQDPALQSRLADTKATEEVRALETFYKTLQSDPLRACYGEKHVDLAANAQAIETLLISDKLFRSDDVLRRKKFVKLVDDVRDLGGDVKIFSSMHVSGEQLDQLTGLCGILRFPMQELDETDSESSDDE